MSVVPASSTFSGDSSARAAQGFEARQRQTVTLAGVLGDHHVLGDVLDVGRRLDGQRRPRHDPAAAVREPRGGAQQHRRVELLGQLEGPGQKVVGLLAVGRLEHGDPGEGGEVAVVLLVLRGMHAGVVGGEHDEAGVDAGQGERHEGVGRDVQPDVLHGHEGARAGQRGADAGLEGDLLVDAPLDDRPAEAGERLDDLGRRRARITAGEAQPGAHRSTGDGFVT